MSAIPDTIAKIFGDTQDVFEQLIKLVIRKTLRPAINPISPNEKRIFNPYTNRYERAFIGANQEDNVNKYNYQLTSNCLGWVDDYITNFKMTARYIKSTPPVRRPTITNRNLLLTTVPVAYNNRALVASDTPPVINKFRATMETVLGGNIFNVIMSNKGEFAYTTDVSYIDCWKQLNSIGHDIINQTAATIPPNVSAKMSTSMLRVRLYTLEQDLTAFLYSNEPLYESYKEMIMIINSLPRNKTIGIISLIAALTYSNWENLTDIEKTRFTNDLGTTFITRFNANKLITILLQSDSSELILKASYLYSVLKMLFVVFGLNYLEADNQTEFIEIGCCQQRLEKLKPHYDKYAGGRITRCPSMDNGSDGITPIKKIIKQPNAALSCSEEVEDCVLAHISAFCGLYPNITKIMGICSDLPDVYKYLSCATIPPSYDGLLTINQFLWRYEEFSYCKYIDMISAKLVNNALSTKVDEKIRYLKTV